MIKEIAAFFGLWFGSVIIVLLVVVGLLWLFFNALFWAWVAVAALLLLCFGGSIWGLSE